VIPFALETSTWEGVKRLCSRLGCTPYTVIATGFFLLLTRWSGRNDACVLSGNFHRYRRGSEEVVGDFVTAYPLRMSIDDKATLEGAVQGCLEAVNDYRKHSQVAPTSTFAAYPEWTRYNLNYLITADDAGASDLGATKLEPLRWHAHELRVPHDLFLILRQNAHGVGRNPTWPNHRCHRHDIIRPRQRIATRALARSGCCHRTEARRLCRPHRRVHRLGARQLLAPGLTPSPTYRRARHAAAGIVVGLAA
jgi:hypothetical protein